MKRFIRLLQPHKGLCLVTGSAVILSVALNVLLRTYLGGILDRILQKSIHWPSVTAVLGAAFICTAVLSYGRSWSITRLLHRLKMKLYQNAYHFLLYDYSDEFTLGELSSLLSNDVSAIANAVNRIFTKLLSDLFCFVFSLAIICSLHPLIAAVVVLASAVPSMIVTAISKCQQEQQQRFMAELGNVNNAASESLFSLESVKANSMEDQYSARFSSALSHLLEKRRHLARTEALLTAPSIFCAFAVQIMIIVTSGWFTAKGYISAGSFFIVIALMDYIINPVMGLENSLLSIRSLNVSLKRLENFLDTRAADSQDKPSASAGTSPSVVLRDVSFSYPQGQDIFHHVSLHLQPGKCHYIVGANGAGKSTLVKLICGVLQPSSGDISVCGCSVASAGKDMLAKTLSVMPQEPVLFSGSLLENIRLYHPGISREAVVDVCKKAGIHEDILTLPDQYDTLLSENGGTLSGGQKQRLSLARTVLRDTPVMIFDEPTAALDGAHAGQAVALMNSLAREKVVIVITHDARMDLKQGNVVRLGGE